MDIAEAKKIIGKRKREVIGKCNTIYYLHNKFRYDQPLWMAQKIIEKSCWWITHPYGEYESPGMASHVTRHCGEWVLIRGSNKFAISKAIRSCVFDVEVFQRRILNDYKVTMAGLEHEFIASVRGSVMNHNDDYYDIYPIDSEDCMVFGSHAIALWPIVEYMRYATGADYLKNQLFLPEE